MKNLTLAGFSILGVLMGTAMAAQAQNATLSEFRWTNRVLVVVAPSATDGDLIAQRGIFQQASKGMTERDVVLVEATGDDDSARNIRAHLGLDGARFRAVLVGKDGNAAFSAARPVTAKELFGKIDAMPMRRDEMRNRR